MLREFLWREEMNLVTKLERLQAANKRLVAENEKLKELNKTYSEDIERIKKSLQISKELASECEKLKLEYV